jgi:hypothetical protein
MAEIACSHPPGWMPLADLLDVPWIRRRGIPTRDCVETPRYERGAKEITIMNILIAIVAIIAVILLFTGGFVSSLNFLLWVGIVLLVLAAIVWLIRFLTGRRTSV